MVHHFDHRWASYIDGGTDDDESARDCTLTEKQDPALRASAAILGPGTSRCTLRAARVPQNLKRAFREKNSCADIEKFSYVAHVAITFQKKAGLPMRESDLVGVLGRGHAWQCPSWAPLRIDFLLESQDRRQRWKEMQRETPLTVE